MIVRRDRQIMASWGYQYLENSSNGYSWQPESLCYFDTTTGREVWRLSSTNGTKNYVRELGFSQWSANGRYIVMGIESGIILL